MRKRLILATVAVAVIACVVLGTLAMLPSRPGVTKANYDRIEEGMTRVEVEELFGEKGKPQFFRATPTTVEIYWEANDGSFASIHFTDDCVDEKDWLECHKHLLADEAFLDKIRRWLHLN